MKENIEFLRGNIKNKSLHLVVPMLYGVIENILNELERLQKDNYKLDRKYQILFEENQELQIKNSNISRELIARTDELNDVLKENDKLKKEYEKINKFLHSNSCVLQNKNGDLVGVLLTPENFIPKQVIRDKIEEYEGLKEMDKMAYEEQIRPLKEILGEE